MRNFLRRNLHILLFMYNNKKKTTKWIDENACVYVCMYVCMYACMYAAKERLIVAA